NGLLVSLDTKVDASLVLRSIDPGYQSFYSNAFTENIFPVNERGMYAGISIRPLDVLSIDAYTDIFSFPWLKYRVDAPSSGKEYFIRLTYTPNKQVELYSHFKTEVKQANRSGIDLTTHVVDNILRQNWRIQSNVSVSQAVTLRNRCEINWYDKKGPGKEQGFLAFQDIFYKPILKPWSGNMRFL